LQIEAIKAKYEEIQNEFLQARRKTEEEMLYYFEEVVGVSFLEFHLEKCRIQTELTNSHSVCINV